ncbi:RNA-directed DNA polymerase, eukaryota, reverse transcriptase zinc-binding domain protein [Tanacetum coccineum]
MLGEVKASLITLVPKSKTPQRVSDYRPIACCNTIYKIMSKILTNRIKSALCKLVSQCQSAFIPRRQITDNILLTQELLRGVLIMFKFPDKLIKWIMVCVITAAFTINVNGVRAGYFKGGRGLRQGDPISPYIFTLAMEVFTLILQKHISEDVKFKYHWGCKDLQISHLCFADDLLVLCHGDLNSVKVVKRALDMFSSVSGLNPNIGKSIVLFGNVIEQDKQEILSILPFKIGSLPVSYLGGELLKGKAKVAWKQVCKPKDEGGLGIKNLSLWNEVLMAKHNLPNFVPKLIEGSKYSYLWETNDGKCKNFSTNKAWMDWRDRERKVDWCDLVWFSNYTSKHSFIVWMAVQDRLITQKRIMKWYLEKKLKCSLCGMKPDSLNHLFFECNYSAKVWKELMKKSDHYAMPNRWDDLLITMTSMRHNKSIKSVLRRIVFAACVYFIWNERNKRLFTNDKKNYNELIAEVVNHIRLKLASLTVKRTCQTVEICKKWKVDLNVKTRYGVPEML